MALSCSVVTAMTTQVKAASQSGDICDSLFGIFCMRKSFVAEQCYSPARPAVFVESVFDGMTEEE